LAFWKSNRRKFYAVLRIRQKGKRKGQNLKQVTELWFTMEELAFTEVSLVVQRQACRLRGSIEP
jgi:hypothetical protein